MSIIRSYVIQLRVPAAKLGVLIDVLKKGPGDILQITPDEQAVATHPPQSQSTPTPHGTQRRSRSNSGTPAQQILVDLFKDGAQISYIKILEKFMEEGLQPHSASPILSRLRREGSIVEVEPYVFQLAGQP